MVIVDTSVWIDYFRSGDKSEKLDFLIDENLVVINDLILTELLPLLIIKQETKVINLLNMVKKHHIHPDWEETYLETNKEQEEYDDLFTNGTGVSKSQVPQFRILRKILRETMDSHDGEAPEEIILAAANTIGFDETRVLDMLKRLKTQGELDSPRKGVYRLL